MCHFDVQSFSQKCVWLCLQFLTSRRVLGVFWKTVSPVTILRLARIKLSLSLYIGGFPGVASRRHNRCKLDPWIRKIPWRRAWQYSQHTHTHMPVCIYITHTHIYDVCNSFSVFYLTRFPSFLLLFQKSSFWFTWFFSKLYLSFPYYQFLIIF